MEWLDIVDEQDQVIGRATRGEIHAQGLIHRACHMLVFNSSGQLFLQKRSMSKDADPGLWDSSAAGHVDADETYIDCAVRELHEELGLVVDAGELIRQFKLPPTAANGMEFAVVYSLVSDAPMTLNPTEITEGKWLDVAAVSDWVAQQPEMLSAAFRDIWLKMQN